MIGHIQRTLICVGVGLVLSPGFIGAQDDRPLLHWNRTWEGCVLQPIYPNLYACTGMLFSEVDLWIFRGGEALGNRADMFQPSDPELGPPETSFASIAGHISEERQELLRTALGEAQAGLAAGGCNLLVDWVPPSPGIPTPEERMSIAWFGKGFRHNRIEVGTDFAEPCPQEVESLVSTIWTLEAWIEASENPKRDEFELALGASRSDLP